MAGQHFPSNIVLGQYEDDSEALERLGSVLSEWNEQYLLLDRGDIDHSARPCSSEFLVTLAEDLLCMNDQLIKWTHHEVNRAKSRRILLALLSELQRLKDNRGLFAVDMDYIEFFNMIDVILQNFVKPDDMKKIENRKFKPAAHKFLQSIRADELFDHQGAFDFRRTVWQQFFHHLAPGVNHIHPQLVRAPSTHFVTKHVIPPGGLEIMREWEANIEEARKRNNPDMPYPGHPVAFPSSIRGFSVFRNQGQSQRHTTLGSVPESHGLRTNETGLPSASKRRLLDELCFDFGRFRMKPSNHPHVPGSVLVTQYTRIQSEPAEP